MLQSRMTSNVGSLKDSSVMDDTRISGYVPLIAPEVLQQELALTDKSKATIRESRRLASDILNGQDDRILVVVGPCSIHDVAAAKEYGQRLKQVADRLSDSLVIVMRAYFEKPRTTVGWKGLINDPFIDGSFKINHGLRTARTLLCDLTNEGIPVGCELLDTISPQFISDLISWGAIGARTTESQLHRELASGSSFPVGFKNGTDGSVDIAFDAIKAASHPHHFLCANKWGTAAITMSKGNPDCHIILRGGKTGPNYSPESLERVHDQLVNAGLEPRIMVDCSHGNSLKQFKNQIKVLDSLCDSISSGNMDIFGIMIESNLHEGSQKIPPEGVEGLKYGVSITDACVGWDDTVKMLEKLAAAQKARRRMSSAEK